MQMLHANVHWLVLIHSKAIGSMHVTVPGSRVLGYQLPVQLPVYTRTDMALFYSRCLQDLPRLTVNDIDRLVTTSCAAPNSKREKGFKMYIGSYIDNYEGK